MATNLTPAFFFSARCCVVETIRRFYLVYEKLRPIIERTGQGKVLRTQHLLLYVQRPLEQGISLGEPSLRNRKWVCVDRGTGTCQRSGLLRRQWDIQRGRGMCRARYVLRREPASEAENDCTMLKSRRTFVVVGVPYPRHRAIQIRASITNNDDTFAVQLVPLVSQLSEIRKCIRGQSSL